MGMFAKFFKKGKFFLKSKTMYLTTASFLRKILIFGLFRMMYLVINKKPRYLNEILNTIKDPVINIYSHPFKKGSVHEKS